MEDDLRERLEEAGIESTQIDEILHGLESSKLPAAVPPQDIEGYLKVLLNNTTDWRRRAQIAAQIISNYYK